MSELDDREPRLRVVTPRLTDEERRTAIYGGELLVYADIEPMHRLCRLTDELVRTILGVADPVRFQSELSSEQIATRLTALRREYSNNTDVKRLFIEALAHIGVDLAYTYWDRLNARVVMHDIASKLGVHRDTWGSNIYAQMNWWAPIYPITPDRGLAIYPTYWARPLANDSADWDLHRLRAQRRSGAEIALVPLPTEEISDQAEVRVAIEPGDLLCFSGAHLHCGVPNRTGLARFNIDTRTVDVRDFVTGRGAANLDGAAPRIAREWFRRVSDDAPLPSAAAGARKPPPLI
jgi:hypothetical protein